METEIRRDKMLGRETHSIYQKEIKTERKVRPDRDNDRKVDAERD
jgi:hypothetical protein